MKAKDLRNSILQLAVQGKLVPQDPNDEPASVLLERIREERAKLIKEKRVKAPKGGESVIYRTSDGSHYEKRGKGEPICIDDEIPFEIPESWEWARLETAYNFIDYRGKTPIKSSDGIRLMTASNVRQGFIDYSREEYISEAEYESRQSRGITHKGDILFTTEAPMGYCALNEMDVCSCGQRVITFQNYYHDALNNALFCQFILSPAFQAQVSDNATGTTAKGIKAARLKDLLLPIPPRNEQKRINERIVSLSPIVNDYGSLEDAREHLDAELPDRLRKSALQLAVQGKLVPQDPADEPASALLDRIRAERAALVKAKKLKVAKGGESVIYRASDGGYYEKRGKGEPVCIDDEIPFEIPESWGWARLGSVLREIVVPQRDKPTSFDGDIAWCRIEDVEGRYLNRAQDGRYVSRETVSNMNLRICPPGTVFSACSGASIGRIAISTIECCTNQTFAGLVCSSGLFNEYLYVFLETIIPQLKQMGSGTTLAYISQAKYANLLLPLPPMDEQKRIVTRVEAMREQLC